MTELSREEVLEEELRLARQGAEHLFQQAKEADANATIQFEARKIIEAALESEQTWFDGYPTKFRAEEWFIAITTYGDRVVLRALPEEYSYDFKTADETYIMRDKIAKWMPFPDSEYISPAAKLLKSERAVSDKIIRELETIIEQVEAMRAQQAAMRKEKPE